MSDWEERRDELAHENANLGLKFANPYDQKVMSYKAGYDQCRADMEAELASQKKHYEKLFDEYHGYRATLGQRIIDSLDGVAAVNLAERPTPMQQQMENAIELYDELKKLTDENAQLHENLVKIHAERDALRAEVENVRMGFNSNRRLVKELAIENKRLLGTIGARDIEEAVNMIECLKEDFSVNKKALEELTEACEFCENIEAAVPETKAPK